MIIQEDEGEDELLLTEDEWRMLYALEEPLTDSMFQDTLEDTTNGTPSDPFPSDPLHVGNFIKNINII